MAAIEVVKNGQYGAAPVPGEVWPLVGMEPQVEVKQIVLAATSPHLINVRRERFSDGGSVGEEPRYSFNIKVWTTINNSFPNLSPTSRCKPW